MRAGEVLEGKFRVERVIGEGAMGLVVEATHLALEERVALKFLRDEAKARPDLTLRFAREARAAATIKNDHVARVYDVGTHDGTPFIVMEMLHGEDLEKLIETRGALDPATAVEYVIQACEGLTAAHIHGIVHRDIKPGNLFVVAHGGVRDVKVLDFGISKAGLKKGTLDDINLGGETTQIMGSPHYMSPEQIRSTKDVDARADIWSLGVVLFELLTGHTPFDGTEITAIIAHVLHAPHRPARSYLANIPPGLEAIIDQCLEKDLSKRYQTAADLAIALVPYAPKRSRAVAERAASMMALATGRDAPADSMPPSALLRTTSQLPPKAPRRTGLWIGVAFGLALLVGLGGFTALASLLRHPKRGAIPEPSATVATTPPVVSVSVTTAATASATPAAETTAAAGSAPAKPGASVRPHPRVAPSASAAPSIPKPDSDIRLER